MDLFEYARQKNMDQEAPLASRLRPTTLEDSSILLEKTSCCTVQSKQIS